jgi:uncharacterized protein (UPF0332 family)
VGTRINAEIFRLLNERKLMKAEISTEMILKEIEAAQTDLLDAQDSLQYNKFKWATIQGYYSMFHSARALLFSKGFREKSHYALMLAIKILFSNELESSLVRQFEEGMALRQEADYGLKFSERGALETISGAEKLLSKAKEILKIK